MTRRRPRLALRPARSFAFAVGLVLANGMPEHARAAWWPRFDGPGQLTNWVFALAWYRGQLVAGGDFVVTNDDTLLLNLGAWDGSRWAPLGRGVEHAPPPCGPPCWARVIALANYGDLLLAGGNFLRAGGNPANYIAAWDGSTWHALGSGTNGWVYDIEVIGNDAYVGGAFTTAGGLVVDNIARWNGRQWDFVGEGLPDGLTGGFVSDLTVFQGQLVAAGRFVVSGVEVGIATWDGVSWRALGDARPSGEALAVLGGALVANGAFFDASSVPYNFAKWDGTSWSPLGRIHLSGGFSNALTVYRGQLLSAHNVGISGPHLLAWDGQTWTPFHSGLDDAVQCLLPMDSTLYVGGRFTHAGGIPSIYVARWDDPSTPILVQDFHAAQTPEGTVHIAWQVADSHEIQTIQVQRAGDPSGPFTVVSPPLIPERDMAFDDAPDLDYSQLWYRLAASAQDGTVEYVGPVLAALQAAARGHVLLPVADTGPGPIDIRYFAAASSDPFRLVVYSVTGRLVRVLHQGRTLPGYHVASWDRDSNAGHPVARGVYFVNLSAGGFSATRKVTVLREK